jgi:hypothetical protein
MFEKVFETGPSWLRSKVATRQGVAVKELQNHLPQAPYIFKQA